MIQINTLPSGARVAMFPSAIVVNNFASGDDAALSQIVSSRPGQAVIFVSTEYTPEVFSQAENTMRTFIFLRTGELSVEVPTEYPAQWVSPGDLIPALPGNISVEATKTGFIVSSIDPDPVETITF